MLRHASDTILSFHEQESLLEGLDNSVLACAIWRINSLRRSLAIMAITWAACLHDPATFAGAHPRPPPPLLPGGTPPAKPPSAASAPSVVQVQPDVLRGQLLGCMLGLHSFIQSALAALRQTVGSQSSSYHRGTERLSTRDEGYLTHISLHPTMYECYVVCALLRRIVLQHATAATPAALFAPQAKVSRYQHAYHDGAFTLAPVSFPCNRAIC